MLRPATSGLTEQNGWPTTCLFSVRNSFSEGKPGGFHLHLSHRVVEEGGMGFFRVGHKSVLLVWPTGGELKAYRGRCPDADVPLNDAKFNGKIITCPHHHWGFDCTSGECVTHTTTKALHPYPVSIEGDEVLVDVGPAKVARTAAC
jgi:toluene monooxygenase system ferredoxin subunit